MVVRDHVHAAREDALDVEFVLAGQEVDPVVTPLLAFPLHLLVEAAQPQELPHLLELVVLAAEEADLALRYPAAPQD